MVRDSLIRFASGAMGKWQLHRLVIMCLAVVWLCKEGFAQEPYNNPIGYACSDSGKLSCRTFLLYRSQLGFQDVRSIAKLFNANATSIARISNITNVNQTLNIGDSVFIPITCRCLNNTSILNVTYKILDGDTFYDLNIGSYESLSSTTAIVNANNVDPTKLVIGQYVSIPIRCACPSLAQTTKGTTALVSYPVQNGDVLAQIGPSFGVPTSDVVDANTLTGANFQIETGTTLLVPINTSRPTYTPPPLFAAQSPASPSQPPSVSLTKSSNSKTGVYIGIGAGGVAIVVLFLALACCFWAVKRQREKSGETADNQAPLMISKSTTSGGTSGVSKTGSCSPLVDKVTASTPTRQPLAPGDPLLGMFDLMGSDRPSVFTFEEIKMAANNFSEGSRIQGSVYRGILKEQVVAIKQMKGSMSEELKILCRVHHTNLVKLVGLCLTETEDMYLVYEYAINGSLSDCLHTDILSRDKLVTKSSSYLSWTVRVQIALDAASGLEYIHDYVNPSYVHKDVKSSNVLLDGNFRAKIANFAMAKSGGNGAMMTRHIVGTYGYMAPEYLAHGLVTTKVDVFAFGVVLLELLSGQEAMSEEASGEERCLYSAIAPILDGDDPLTALRRWMDPILESNYPTEAAVGMASLAKVCVDGDPSVRPSMKDVTFALSNILTSSMEWETSSAFSNSLREIPIEAR